MKFNSQICTTREQSERLLALGLKKETADMEIHSFKDDEQETFETGYANKGYMEPELAEIVDCFPAWSLHRLIEIIPSNIIKNEKRYDFSLDCGCSLYEYDNINEFGGYEYDCIGTLKDNYNLYDDLINQIEWLIKEGHFNKEYLED